jgi:uncharacterized protein YcbK (DUF882 family)
VNEVKIGRRNFIGLGMLGFVCSFFPRGVLAASRHFITIERSLSLYNTHTGESLNTVYWAQNEYLPDALDDLNYILRDHRTGEIKPVDTQLLDLLHALNKKLCARHPFHIISGYRSQATNDWLRRRGGGVAKNSLHIQGKAADIRLPGCDLSVLRKSAMQLRSGGVGYYPRSNFVHLDIGRLRHWSF